MSSWANSNARSAIESTLAGAGVETVVAAAVDVVVVVVAAIVVVADGLRF
jgi:hypothetical protein